VQTYAARQEGDEIGKRFPRAEDPPDVAEDHGHRYEPEPRDDPDERRRDV
jgi:hypothetical protein